MRLLLAPEVDRAAIDALALSQGWVLASIFSQRHGRPRQLVFASAAGTELVTYVEDHRIDARYLVVDGHDPSELALSIRNALPCLDLDDVRALIESAERRARGIAWCGVLAPERASEPILGWLRDALDDEDALVREAARFAAEATTWPELGLASRSREGLGKDPRPAPPLLASTALPERPRLSDTVVARMHVADGGAKVVLTDWPTATVLQIDLESWRALEAADGTRDLDALALALAREGVYRGEADLVQLLSELSAAGVLTDGLAVPAPPPPVEVETTPLDRPLDVLPGFTLVCDGSGSCCRFYGSVAFSPSEARRAQAIAEDVRLPIAPRDLFTPSSGAQLDEHDVRAVAQIDGRCAFLEGDGLCLLHRRGGAEAKPFPCSFYPALLMDDGESVRVSLGPECACIFASAGRSDGVPLVPRAARTLGDLDPVVATMRVPNPVPLSARSTASRSELSCWSTALVGALARTDADALALAWTLASSMAEHGLDLSALDRALAHPSLPDRASLAPWIASLREHAERAASTAESWRGGSDLSRRVARWIADALCVADLSALSRSASDPASERFYLRALAHGHRLAIEGRTLEHGLFDRATRILAARAMAAIAPPSDTSARYPLALLEAAMRNLGLVRYADAVAR